MEQRKDIKMVRCTGHCCRLFWLPYKPKHLKAMEDAKKRGKKSFRWPIGAKGKGNYNMIKVNTDDDLLYIADMVIPVEEAVNNPATGKEHDDRGKKGYHYTCKHFDKETNNCKEYESRPQMCIQYPDYGRKGVCQYVECTHGSGMKEFTKKNGIAF